MKKFSIRGFWAVLLGGYVFLGYAKGPLEYEQIQNKLDVDYEEKPWVEVEYQLPKPPEPQNLVPFYVSATNPNRFAIDLLSLSVDADGVVRYTLVVTSPAGAKNISYEGLRCKTAERRLYAFGRADGHWSKARNSDWVKIEDNSLNRHHAALYADYFCVSGPGITDTKALQQVLKDGGPRVLP